MAGLDRQASKALAMTEKVCTEVDANLKLAASQYCWLRVQLNRHRLICLSCQRLEPCDQERWLDRKLQNTGQELLDLYDCKTT